jgi:hypothetical protein
VAHLLPWGDSHVDVESPDPTTFTPTMAKATKEWTECFRKAGAIAPCAGEF